MSSIWGRFVRVSIFGESHGAGIGVVLDGLPAGLSIDWEEVCIDLRRRAPGGRGSTPRKEADEPEILSGIRNGHTTGAPLCALIRNADTRSGDYAELVDHPRPGHADYTAHVKYAGFNDPRGGGHFSGRLTAPLVFAGSIARAYLARQGVHVGAHILRIGECWDESETVDREALQRLRAAPVPVFAHEAGERMLSAAENARAQCDSLGGIVEAFALGLPIGWGEPFFESVESVLSGLLFSIPSVKGVEFGEGFGLAGMRGSEANDRFLCANTGVLRTATNHCGGILGGITNGMPLIVRTVCKPTPSIAMRQDTARLSTGQTEPLRVPGRHDPCVVFRAVPVVESAVCLGLFDLALAAAAR